ncbi:hypothetical protein BC827DRAFT_1158619 [Russula dissimulans]|nr:hypothetical protein BC827DRAFT_1158619 [Russula dissimulans]
MVDQHVTIEVLPDDILLQIFAFYRLPNKVLCRPFFWSWHTLVQVCRRWRYVILVFPHSLRPYLVTTYRSHRLSRWVSLDHWPPFPISIQYYNPGRALTPEEENDLATVLEQPDRINEICLSLPRFMFEKSTAWVETSFPELERLCLKSDEPYLDLPNGFLGASINSLLRLRHIHLSHISFPELPQLLLSCHDLVSIVLGPYLYVDAKFPSSETVTAALSATTQLKRLTLRLDSSYDKYHPEERREPSAPTNLLCLSSLIEFDFRGCCHYLEDFVSRIDAPHLERLRVSFHHQQVVDIFQLSGFISRTEQLRLMPYRTLLELWTNGFSIRHTFKHPSCHVTNDESNWLQIGCYGDSWHIPQLVHINTQLSPLTSTVERLQVKAWGVPPILTDDMDPAPWVQLFRHFDGVQYLCLYSNAASGTAITRCLEQSAADPNAQELFPALCTLRLIDFGQNAKLDSFVAAHNHMVLSTSFSRWRSAIREYLDCEELARLEDAESDMDLLF